MHRAHSGENGSPNSSETERKQCITRLNFKKNVINSLKDSWKKVKKQEDLLQMGYSAEKDFFATDFGTWKEWAKFCKICSIEP